MNLNLYAAFADKIGKEKIVVDGMLRDFTAFRVGGRAPFIVRCTCSKEVAEAVNICKEQGADYFVMGNGSNLLVSDNGYNGVIIRLDENHEAAEWKDTGDGYVTASFFAGKLLTGIGVEAAKCGYAGMEFATGIPGSLGGAVAMNAGAYGGEMKDIVTK